MTDLDLRAGKLEQSCPDCGRWEAAGSYCSGCGRPMGAADWYPNGDLERRAVARQAAPRKAQTPVKGGPGRPRADVVIRRLAERRSPDLAGGRFGASPASRDETPALRSGPESKPTGAELAVMSDADFASFIEDSGIATLSKSALGRG